MSQTKKSPVDNSGRFKIFTYGCQMNAHESEKIAGVLQSLGYAPTDDEAEADVIILNTCCIRDSAEQRIIGHIGALKKHKTKRPDMIIGVTGCLGQQAGSAERLRKSFPFLDIILGTQNLGELEVAVRRKRDEKLSTFKAPPRAELNLAPDMRDAGAIMRNRPPCAYVNIMYGCDNYCSYCVVPYVRGPEASRSAGSVVEEVRSLTKTGYKDVTLLGQNVNSYMSELSFSELLKRILDETDISRLRFMTSHPKDLSDGLIGLMGREKRLCPHVHLPVQSGSDAVLKAMNRKYTRRHYLELVEKIRENVQDVALTTDVIVGFPGETDEDFHDTLTLLSDVRFDAAYTFVYSPRRGTKAAAMAEQVSREEKKRRIVELVDLQNAITREINAGEVGKVREVLVESVSARNKNDVCGKTEGGKTVNFPGSQSLIGRLVPVRITEAKSSTLFGRQEDAWPS